MHIDSNFPFNIAMVCVVNGILCSVVGYLTVLLFKNISWKKLAVIVALTFVLIGIITFELTYSPHIDI
ncbi:MAG: hypothetical protein A2W23_03030 [Planctomycetes bacterium RBG_16_43_13]|nr:MAG: hypothetical protein A2W23_03030 [Planctomycetes bacterium RBG_16_43_13]